MSDISYYLKYDVLVVLKLNHHVPRLPIHIPCLHSRIPPGLDVVTILKAHPHHPV